MDYRYVNAMLDGYSIIVCLVLLLYQMVDSRIKAREKRKNISNSGKWFTSMVVFNMLMLIGDMCDWKLGGKPGAFSYYFQFIFGIIVYFSSSGLLLFSLYGWIISNINQKTKITSLWIKIGAVLSSVQVILAVTTPIHKMCYIDEQNYYQRGDWFWASQICPYIVYFVAIYLLIKYRKAFRKKEMFYLAIFVTIPVFAEIIQVATYVYTTLNVSITVGLIMVFAFIQSQREYENEKRMHDLLSDKNHKLEEMQMIQEKLSDQLIDVLCGTVEAKDQYTRGHSLRVAQYAREIMYRLGGDEKAQQEAYYIGILHDVGKISVKDQIINKKGRLTDEEYEQIKLHTIAGYQILREVDVIPDLAIGARWHHERFDGTGYPNGLAGDNIPLVARIISVADAYDAMTSNRSYHDVMPREYVKEQIKKGMGTQFDPQIAQIMLDMIDEDIKYEMKQVKHSRAFNILIIDDDPFIHKMVEQALMDENYILTSAYSGQEGIDILKANKFDVCLLDMEMPGIKGFDVLKWIHGNVRRLKVIFLTGDKELETIKKSEELGARDYITKPINITILKESIRSVIAH